MEAKHRCGIFVTIGFTVMIIGSLLAIIPFIGLPLMGIGTLICIIGIAAILVIVFKERKKDFHDMNENISKEDLRP